MTAKNRFREYAADPCKFRNDLLVDVDGQVKQFGAVQDEWQKADFASMDAALLNCTGQRVCADARMRAFLERPRGHSKTTDLGVTCCYAMAFATRSLRGYAYAADRDQSSLLKDAIHRLLRLNPWLGDILEVQRDCVVNKARSHPGEGSVLAIATSDVGSSYGILPDFIIADELCHWQEGSGEALWHSLISSAAKRSNCFFAVITNAGFVDTWQWKTREAIRGDEAWYFSRLNGPQASWMTPTRLAEQRRLLPPVAFARLWENQWSSGGGDALSEADIKAAFKEKLFPMNGNEADYSFIAGVDLGLTRDCSAIVVLGVQNSGHRRIRLARTKLWRPAAGRKIELSEVELTLRDMHKQFNFESIAYDPWQAEHLSQRLRHDSLPMLELTQSGKNLQAIAARLIEAFTDRRLDLFDEANLKRDLLKLRVEERSYGYRLVSPRDEYGHGDLASAFGMALLTAHELAGQVQLIASVIF